MQLSSWCLFLCADIHFLPALATYTDYTALSFQTVTFVWTARTTLEDAPST